MKIISTLCCSFAYVTRAVSAACFGLKLHWKDTRSSLGDKELSDPKNPQVQVLFYSGFGVPHHAASGCLTMLLALQNRGYFPLSEQSRNCKCQRREGPPLLHSPGKERPLSVQRRLSWSSGSIFRSGFVQTSLPLVRVASNNRFQIRKQLFFCLILIIGYFRFV